MRITEQSRQALMILVALAERHPAGATAADLAAAVGLPETTIFKVLKTLTRHGFVASRRGRGGGLRLSRPSGDITLGEVLRAFEPRFGQCAPAALLTESGMPAHALIASIDAAIGASVAAFLRHADGVTLTAIGREASDRPPARVA